MSFRRLTACAVLALLPLTASALSPADFTLAPGLTARRIASGIVVNIDGAGEEFNVLAGGSALLKSYTNLPTPTWTLSRLNDNGSIDLLATIRTTSAWAVPDPATGAIWIRHRDTSGSYEFWKIEGLPRTMSAGSCPSPPGDFTPGTIDNSTVPPTLHANGNGTVDIADVVALLRTSVGLQTIACGP